MEKTQVERWLYRTEAVKSEQCMKTFGVLYPREGFLKEINFVAIREVIKDEQFLKSLIEGLQGLKLVESSNDLMRLHQLDLTLPTIQSPSVKKINEVLKNEVRPLLEQVYKFKSTDKITVTCSKYVKNDYLLCHDDKFGDRYIAFVLYLTPSWTREDGGMLRFFKHDPVTNEPLSEQYEDEILPEYNTLIAFKVSDITHHEVEQIYNSSKVRLSVNGWFHKELEDVLEKSADHKSVTLPIKLQQDEEPISESKNDKRIACGLQGLFNDKDKTYKKVINGEYDLDDTINILRCQMDVNSVILAASIFKKDFYNKCCNEFMSAKSWHVVGPPYFRVFDSLKVVQKGSSFAVTDENMPNVEELLALAINPDFIRFVSRITNFNLSKEKKICRIEIGRWCEGSYTMITDSDVQNEEIIVDCTFCFNVDDDHFKGPDSKDCGSIFFSTDRTLANYKRTLLRAKYQRIFSDIIESNFKRSDPSKVSNLSQAKRNKVKKKVIAIVKNKILKLVDYRRRNHPDTLSSSLAPSEYVPLVPNSNSMILNMRWKGCTKFSSPIVISKVGSRKPVYYTVSFCFVMLSS